VGHVIKRHGAAAKFLRRISLNDRLRQGVRSDMGDRQRFPRRVRAKVLESPGRRVSNPIAVSNWSARKAASRAPPDPSRWPARRRSGQTRSTDTRDNAALRIRASRRAGRVSRALAWRRHGRVPAARFVVHLKISFRPSCRPRNDSQPCGADRLSRAAPSMGRIYARVSWRYLMRCGRSASAPIRALRSASYSE
jgi:hypothetical protein